MTVEDNHSIMTVKSQRPKCFDALADKLIEGDINFHLSCTPDDGTITNQRLTRTADETKARATNSMEWYLKTNRNNDFDSISMFNDKKQLQINFKVLGKSLRIMECFTQSFWDVRGKCSSGHRNNPKRKFPLKIKTSQINGRTPRSRTTGDASPRVQNSDRQRQFSQNHETSAVTFFPSRT